MCGGTVRKPNGELASARWHAECLHRWRLMSDQSYARAWVFRRDKGACRNCGETTEDWQLDHDAPLAEAAGDPTKWTMNNMRTRCRGCHAAKTAGEAAERARARQQGGRQE